MTRTRYTSSLVVMAVAVAIALISARTPQARSGDGDQPSRDEAAARSAKAAKALDGIMADPDKAIPRDLLAHAKAVAVFPEVLKVAFVGGGGGGRGVVSRRIGDAWGDPAFFRADDDLNSAVYNKTARQLLSDQPGAAAASDLLAFPRAVGRCTTATGESR